MRNYLIFTIIMCLHCLSCENNLKSMEGYRIEYRNRLDHYIAFSKGPTFSAADDSVEIRVKGVRIKYHYPDGKIDTVFSGRNWEIISSYVDFDECSSDKNFLLVAQKPLRNICECNDTCRSNKYGSDVSSFQLCDKAIKDSKEYSYWIIIKQSDDVFGPYSKTQYLLMREKLNIPVKLKMKWEKV
jgi:hypothetical protein